MYARLNHAYGHTDICITSRIPNVSLEIPHPSESLDSQDLIPSASQGVSQTQEETQLPMDTQVEEGTDLKRQTPSSFDEERDSGRKKKKVKISIGPPVDLGD